MQELSEKQIAYLKRFLVRHYVRYEDVQLELIDHIASAVEEKSVDRSLTFEHAVEDVYKDFGVGGFSKIVKEKEKAMMFFWRKHIWQSFLEFLRPPLLFWGIALFSLLYLVQYQFEFLLFSKSGFLIFFISFVAVTVFYKLYVQEDKIEKYLFLRTYFGVAAMLLYFTVYVIPYFADLMPLMEQSTHPEIFLSISSFYFTLNIILIYILAFKIPKSLLRQMKNSYKQYVLS